MTKRVVACVVAALSCVVLPAAGQSESAGIQRGLDKVVQLEVADMPIGDVFAKLQADTGVKFVIDDDTLEYLPYGDQTRLAVTLKHVTLRKALTPMLAPQALQWEIDGDTIRIRPSEPLYRICRRATFEELTVLGHLETDVLKPSAEGGAVIDQLRKLTGRADLKLVFRGKGEEKPAEERAERSLPGTGVNWLEALCHTAGWTWHLHGDDIVILDRQAQVQRQLERHVSLRYQNAPLVTVLLDLARKGRVKLTLAPGVMGLLPDATRENFNLMIADATISQAMEVISGATGLAFKPTADGVDVEASDTLANKSGATSQPTRARYFVRMTLPGPQGTQMEVFLRPEELPDDIQQMIERAKDDYIQKLRGEDQPRLVPATMPAAEPGEG